MLPVLAVDLGAGSGRVAVVDLDARPLAVRVVHRFAHEPRRDGATLRWDWDGIVAQVRTGLDRALDAAMDGGADGTGPVASIGIDTWGVDYGLCAGGRLLAPPVSYRDARTAGWRAVARRLGEQALYTRTGIQLMAVNTIFQLAAEDPALLAAADRLLMLPELLVAGLTGVQSAERTSAATTAMVDLGTGTWAAELLEAVGVPAGLVLEPRAAGTLVGAYRGVPVHLVGGHDTASAVLAMASPAPDAAFVASGTWMLVGAERAEPDVSEAARAANFSNEAGAFGGVRLLRNVMGLWLLERCREDWGDPPLHELLADAAARPAGGPVVDATDERFLAPASMDAEVRAAAGLGPDAPRGVVARCVLDSLAASTAAVVDQLDALTGARRSELHLLGGGARNGLLRDLLESASGRPVRVGEPEATALGNALAQGIALGRFTGVAEARAALAGVPGRG